MYYSTIKNDNQFNSFSNILNKYLLINLLNIFTNTLGARILTTDIFDTIDQKSWFNFLLLYWLFYYHVNATNILLELQ